MDENLGVKVVLGITLLAALSLFLISDHSGLSITDVNLEQSEFDSDTYELTYILRNAITYNSLDSRYVLYDENDNVITVGGTFIGQMHGGSRNINETITVSGENNESKKFSPKKVEIMLYSEKFDSNLKNEEGSYYQKPVYNSTFFI